MMTEIINWIFAEGAWNDVIVALVFFMIFGILYLVTQNENKN